ncbi:MAG: hypothetical protein ABIZ49_05680 [Opitutaceae bacterium]
MRIPLLILVASAIIPAASAQSAEESGSEEVLELSPFQISFDRDREQGYMAGNSVAGTRMATPLIDPRAGNIPPSVPVSIFKRANAVAVQFVLSHTGDKQELRNKELYSSVEAIETQVAKIEGLRMEQREVRFAGGDRKVFSSSRGNSTVSFASIVIFAELPAGVRVVDRVKQVRDALNNAKPVGQTKMMDGSVGLYLKSPEQYRREILQKVFDDLAFVAKGVGPDFEVRPAGLNQRVRMRVSAEAEIELWIDYSFSIHSLRELAKK